MSKIGSQSCFTGAASKGRVRINRKWLTALLGLALLLGSWPARADGPDDEYLQIYTLIQQADDLNTSGKAAPAKAKYQEAQTALSKFQKDYPDWNVKLVAYRLNYLAQKVAALSVKPPVAASAAPAQTSGTQFKLLEAGAEPRTVLRLHPSPGDKQTLALTMKMTIETKMGGAETPAMKLPAITMTMDATVKAVSDKGDITCELVMGDISLGDEAGGTPGLAEAMKTALAGVKGISGTATISSRGFSQGVEFKAPAGANPQARHPPIPDPRRRARK